MKLNQKNGTKISDWFTIILLGACILAFSGGTFMSSKTHSVQERRQLIPFPKLTIQTVWSGEFQESIEPYLEDHIAYRDQLLSLYSVTHFLLWNNLDTKGIVDYQDHKISLEQIMNQDSLEYAAQLLNGIDAQYLQNTDCKIYLSIIPDKSFFIEELQYVVLDYDELLSAVVGQNQFATYIDITDQLSLGDFYTTDPHWDQSKLIEVVKKLAQSMSINLDLSFDQQVLDNEYKGLYASKFPWMDTTDQLSVLQLKQMKDWIVTSYKNGNPEEVPVYDFAKIQSMEPYDVFLSGGAGLITIDNPHGPKGKELVVFRDSYGLSLTPLLASGYEKVVLIDIRSLPVSQIGKYVTFTNQDVLFLYSTSALNHSKTFKQ